MACEPKKNNCVTTVTQRSINENVTLNVVDDELVLTIGNRIYKTPLPEGSGGGGNANIDEYTIPITVNNQSVFLNVIPSGSELFAVLINGVTEKSNEYSTNGTSLTWLNVSYSLETTDELKIYTKVITT